MIKPIKLDLEPGKFYILNVRHDHDCRYWQNDDLSECSCEPELEQVEVNDDNLRQVSQNWVDDEHVAERLRALARRRN